MRRKGELLLTKLIVIAGLFLFLCSGYSIGSSEKLWNDKVNIKSNDGKDLIMKFEEIERQEGYSIARVEFTSGASVPSIMFIVKGFYTIAKLRGKKYFINLQEWHDKDDNWMYKVGFVNAKNIDLIKTYGSDIKSDLDLEAFMSVEEYDLLWGRIA